MEFQEMNDEEPPHVNLDEIIADISENDTYHSAEDSVSKISATDVDMFIEQPPSSGDGVAVAKLEPPSASSSNSKHISVTSDTKSKGIQEFVRILRPHLPRKSKSRAYKLLQNIAKGITLVDNSFQRKIRKKKQKKRPMRKPRTQKNKAKRVSGFRRNARSLYGSSDSSRSEASCPRCGNSCCKVGKY